MEHVKQYSRSIESQQKYNKFLHDILQRYASIEDYIKTSKMRYTPYAHKDGKLVALPNANVRHTVLVKNQCS